MTIVAHWTFSISIITVATRNSYLEKYNVIRKQKFHLIYSKVMKKSNDRPIVNKKSDVLPI